MAHLVVEELVPEYVKRLSLFILHLFSLLVVHIERVVLRVVTVIAGRVTVHHRIISRIWSVLILNDNLIIIILVAVITTRKVIVHICHALVAHFVLI